MMKRFFTVVMFLMLAVLLPGVGYADFLRGLEGFERGDYATALKEWRPLAEQGDIEAQINLAEMYRFGWGVPRDGKEAVKWLRLSAVQGDAGSAYKLGNIYKGQGLPGVYADPVEAAVWLQIAVNRGNTEALYDLGELYYRQKRYNKAAEALRLSSQSGNLGAIYILGKLYKKGLGVPQDINIANQLQHLAMQRGLSAEQKHLIDFGPKQVQSAAVSPPAINEDEEKGPIAPITTAQSPSAENIARPSMEPPTVQHALQAPSKPSLPTSSRSGSGFFVSKRGHVLTNAHVVKGCRRVTVGDGPEKQTQTDIISMDRIHDLALLKLSSLHLSFSETSALNKKLGVRLVPLAGDGLLRSGDVSFGEKVLAAEYLTGFLSGNSVNVTEATVRATDGREDDLGVFQLTASAQLENSGGPIYDAYANIVGIVVSQEKKIKNSISTGSRSDNQRYGVNASTVKKFLDGSGLASKWSVRSRVLSNQDLATIASMQTLMVMCLQ